MDQNTDAFKIELAWVKGEIICSRDLNWYNFGWIKADNLSRWRRSRLLNSGRCWDQCRRLFLVKNDRNCKCEQFEKSTDVTMLYLMHDSWLCLNWLRWGRLVYRLVLCGSCYLIGFCVIFHWCVCVSRLSSICVCIFVFSLCARFLWFRSIWLEKMAFKIDDESSIEFPTKCLRFYFWFWCVVCNNGWRIRFRLFIMSFNCFACQQFTGPYLFHFL